MMRPKKRECPASGDEKIPRMTTKSVTSAQRLHELDFLCGAIDCDLGMVCEYIEGGGDVEVRATKEEITEHRQKRCCRTVLLLG